MICHHLLAGVCVVVKEDGFLQSGWVYHAAAAGMVGLLQAAVYYLDSC